MPTEIKCTAPKAVPISLLEPGKLYWVTHEDTYYDMPRCEPKVECVVAVRCGDSIALVPLEGAAPRLLYYRTTQTHEGATMEMFHKARGLHVFAEPAHDHCYRTREAAFLAAIAEMLQHVQEHANRAEAILVLADKYGVLDKTDKAEEQKQQEPAC